MPYLRGADFKVLISATKLMLFSDVLSDLAVSITLLLFLSYHKILTEICFIKCVTQSIRGVHSTDKWKQDTSWK